MHTGRGLPLLLLFFLTSLVVGQSTIPPANQCAVPKMDQDFCNSFHSLCLATPNKLCLAQSISQCIEETRLPYNILLTTIEYLREFIRRITIAVNTPAPTPAPTSPATTRKPIVPYPTPPPPPPPPPPITSLRPVTPPPPPTRPPTTTVRPGTSILQTTAATGIGVTIQINTGSGFIDFIIELLYSFDNKQINTALFEDLHNNGLYLSIRHDYAVNLQMSSADVEYLALKIEYLVLAFSQYDIKQLNAVAQLKYLLSTNRVFYYWLSTTVDNIYTNLGSSVDEIITKPFDEHTTSVNVNYTIFITSYYTRRHVYQCLSTASPAICQRYCTNSYGGNWIGIQARERSKEALQNFNRPRADYAAGFGDWEKGYWMGLECVYEITNRGRFELLVELANANGETAVAHYADFSIGGSEDGYTLRLGAFIGGAAGDALSASVGRQFTTLDYDADDFNGNCAVKHQGGWWYKNCQKKSVKNFLNGYFSSEAEREDSISSYPYFGVRWETWDTPTVIVATRIFIREVQADDPRLSPWRRI